MPNPDPAHRWPQSTVDLARDVWLFVAGRSAARTAGELVDRLGEDGAPPARTVQHWARRDGWDQWAERHLAAMAPALIQATRDLALVNAPGIMLGLVRVARGDAAATAGQVAAALGVLRMSAMRDVHPGGPSLPDRDLSALDDAALDALVSGEPDVSNPPKESSLRGDSD